MARPHIPSKQVAVPLVKRITSSLGSTLPGEPAGITGFLAEPHAVGCRPARVSSAAKLFVVEPHFDDAVLSAGGLLSAYSGPVTIVTVFSNSESYHPQLHQALRSHGVDLSGLREEEGNAAAAALGATWIGLGFENDVVSRTRSEEEEALRISEIAQELRRVLPLDATVLFPAAFGRHPDHLAVSLCAQGFPGHVFFEDLSPIPAYAGITEHFWRRYHALMRDHRAVYVDITGGLCRKVELLSLYRSQFTPRQAGSVATYAQAVALSRRHLEPGTRVFDAAERFYVTPAQHTELAAAWSGWAPGAGAETGVRSLRAERDGAAIVGLPEPEYETADLDDAFLNRRSDRALTGSPIPLATLAQVLHRACRATEYVETPVGRYARFPYPTSGGLASTQVIVVAWRIETLTPAVYLYDSQRHQLVRQTAALPSRRSWLEAMEGQDWVLGASVAFVLAVDQDRCAAKYTTRAKRLLPLEAGHSAQAIEMAMVPARLAGVFVAGFDPDAIRPVCGRYEPLGIVLAAPPVDTTVPAASPSAPDWLAMPDGPQHPAEAPLLETTHSADCLTVQSYTLGEGAFWIARCRVPSSSHWASGWGISGVDSHAARRLATVRAFAEARELWTAMSSVPSDLVFCRAAELPGDVVTVQRLLLDGRQRHALAQGRLDPERSPRHAMHWVRAWNLRTRAPVWLPADAVLLTHRFLSWTILPSSTGLGCGPDPAYALRHAVGELIEKTVALTVRLRWSPPAPGAGNESMRLWLLEREPALTLREARVGDLWLASAVCPVSGMRGGGVDADAGSALDAAMAECVMKLIDGTCEFEVVDSFAGEDAATPCPDEPTLDGVLDALNLDLAARALEPLEEPAPLADGLSVVRAVAYTRLPRSL